MNAITHDRANAVAPHFPGRVSDNALLVVEQHAKTAVRQYFVYLAFNDEEFFFRHPFRLAGDSRPTVCRSEEHTSELQSLMRISYAVFCLKKKNNNNPTQLKHVD